MKKDEYVLTKELRRLEKYGFLFQAKRIGISERGGYQYDILFTKDKKVLEPGCDATEILGIINSLETCLELYASRSKTIEGNKQATVDAQNSEPMDLFDELKRLRLEFARTEGVSAFCVFTNKTLNEMCEKLPTTEAEMLGIRGVGETKFNKYGRSFIKIIAEYKSTHPEEVSRNRAGLEIRESEKVERKSFRISNEDKEKFEYKELYYMFELRDELNRICSVDNVKKISISQIWNYLASEGLVSEENIGGVHKKSATSFGEDKGIINVEKVGKSGIHYNVLMLKPEAQKRIVEHFADDVD
jgi:ATP-dependent DNA helicase RecQ